MAFKKGESGNAKGRPKGARGKLPKGVREFIKDIIDDNREKMERDLKMLEPKERIDVMVKLMGFVVPKPQSIVVQDITPTESNLARSVDIDDAPEEIRNAYYNYLDWAIASANENQGDPETDDNENQE